MSLINEAPAAGFRTASAPVNGTDEIQTLTIGGTPAGGTFRLKVGSFPTSAITWSATNATLLANILAALIALPSVRTGNITVTAGSLTAGIGTILLTYTVAQGKKVQANAVVYSNSLTGTSPTLVITETTPGVTASGRGASPGVLLSELTAANPSLYQNTGTDTAPVWKKVGSVLSAALMAQEISLTETAGAGAFTGSVDIPAGATIQDIIVSGVALWTNSGTATLKVGDAADDDGFYTGVDLKATDLLAGETFSFALAGGKAGAYIAGSQANGRYNASARTISAIATTGSTGGGAGRTRVLVLYCLPQVTVAATKA